MSSTASLLAAHRQWRQSAKDLAASPPRRGPAPASNGVVRAANGDRQIGGFLAASAARSQARAAMRMTNAAEAASPAVEAAAAAPAAAIARRPAAAARRPEAVAARRPEAALKRRPEAAVKRAAKLEGPETPVLRPEAAAVKRAASLEAATAVLRPEAALKRTSKLEATTAVLRTEAAVKRTKPDAAARRSAAVKTKHDAVRRPAAAASRASKSYVAAEAADSSAADELPRRMRRTRASTPLVTLQTPLVHFDGRPAPGRWLQNDSFLEDPFLLSVDDASKAQVAQSNTVVAIRHGAALRHSIGSDSEGSGNDAAPREVREWQILLPIAHPRPVSGPKTAGDAKDAAPPPASPGRETPAPSTPPTPTPRALSLSAFAAALQDSPDSHARESGTSHERDAEAFPPLKAWDAVASAGGAGLDAPEAASAWGGEVLDRNSMSSLEASGGTSAAVAASKRAVGVSRFDAQTLSRGDAYLAGTPAATDRRKSLTPQTSTLIALLAQASEASKKLIRTQELRAEEDRALDAHLASLVLDARRLESLLEAAESSQGLEPDEGSDVPEPFDPEETVDLDDDCGESECGADGGATRALNFASAEFVEPCDSADEDALSHGDDEEARGEARERRDVAAKIAEQKAELFAAAGQSAREWTPDDDESISVAPMVDYVRRELLRARLMLEASSKPSRKRSILGGRPPAVDAAPDSATAQRVKVDALATDVVRRLQVILTLTCKSRQTAPVGELLSAAGPELADYVRAEAAAGHGGGRYVALAATQAEGSPAGASIMGRIESYEVFGIPNASDAAASVFCTPCAALARQGVIPIGARDHDPKALRVSAACEDSELTDRLRCIFLYRGLYIGAYTQDDDEHGTPRQSFASSADEAGSAPLSDEACRRETERAMHAKEQSLVLEQVAALLERSTESRFLLHLAIDLRCYALRGRCRMWRSVVRRGSAFLGVTGLAPALTGLGNALLKARRPRAALETYSVALRVKSSYAAALSSTSPHYNGAPRAADASLIPTLFNLGTAHKALANSSAALDAYDAALRVARRVGGRKGEAAAGAALHARASLAEQRPGGLPEAIAAYSQALTVRAAALGADSPAAADTLWCRGRAKHRAGDESGALDDLEKALVIRQRTLGDAHPAVATCQFQLAHVYVATARHGDAADMLDAALAIRAASFGARHPACADAALAAADVYAWLGDHATSAKRYRAAYEAYGAADAAQGAADAYRCAGRKALLQARFQAVLHAVKGRKPR
ncbi:hypothetical protein M885DRAFT_585822 [Pelagophyceae sp. CCMP2097]|nr:hypothetical protein M885DRAFT_585822 [Pelagophyceae sp. CCMP2097]